MSVATGLVTEVVSQYQVHKVRTCVLGSSDFASSTRECELPQLITSQAFLLFSLTIADL